MVIWVLNANFPENSTKSVANTAPVQTSKDLNFKQKPHAPCMGKNMWLESMVNVYIYIYVYYYR